MSFSRARSIPPPSLLLLLLVALFRLSEAGTPAPTAAIENTSQQTADSISKSKELESTTFSPGTSGSSKTTEDGKQQTEVKTPDLNVTRHNITIKEFSTAVVKNITLVNPTSLELLCTVDINHSSDKAMIEVTWRMGNTTVKDDNITKDEHQNIWSSQYTVNITNRDHLGTYTCVFKTKQKAEGRFDVRVPEVEGKSKGLVSYEGDAVVMACNSGKLAPFEWVWYTTNGSEQAVINDTLRPEKYQISGKNLNVTTLKVLSLTEKDGGVYCCEAVFLQLGERRGNASLKVLTYLVPLKPFLAIAAEVIILVAIIFIYEIYTKKKEPQAEGEKEFEQTEQLKSEDSNGVENSTTRHRKV